MFSIGTFLTGLFGSHSNIAAQAISTNGAIVVEDDSKEMLRVAQERALEKYGHDLDHYDETRLKMVMLAVPLGTFPTCALLALRDGWGIRNALTLHQSNFFISLELLLGVQGFVSVIRRMIYDILDRPAPSESSTFDRAAAMSIVGLANYALELEVMHRNNLDIVDYLAGLGAITLYGFFDLLFDDRIRPSEPKKSKK